MQLCVLLFLRRKCRRYCRLERHCFSLSSYSSTVGPLQAISGGASSLPPEQKSIYSLSTGVQSPSVRRRGSEPRVVHLPTLLFSNFFLVKTKSSFSHQSLVLQPNYFSVCVCVLVFTMCSWNIDESLVFFGCYTRGFLVSLTKSCVAIERYDKERVYIVQS